MVVVVGEGLELAVVDGRGRQAGEVAEVLRETGRLDDAVWGSALGLPEESVRSAAEMDGTPLPYLSTLIAPPRRSGGRGGKL